MRFKRPKELQENDQTKKIRLNANAHEAYPSIINTLNFSVELTLDGFSALGAIPLSYETMFNVYMLSDGNRCVEEIRRWNLPLKLTA